jgi:hypothetical protein
VFQSDPIRTARKTVSYPVCPLPALLFLTVLSLTAAVPGMAQNPNPSNAPLGTVVGIVLDVTNNPVPGATVVLQGAGFSNDRAETTGENGYFGFQGVTPGSTYQITVIAAGFDNWLSPSFDLEPGEYKVLTDIKLRLAPVLTSITVRYTSEEIATQEVKAEEKQRVLGFIPNFYVVYEPHPQPLTTKLKFHLALRVARDPITLVGIGTLAGTQQGGDTPNYGQGAQGFGKRFGANAADGFTDIMIGGAILPSRSPAFCTQPHTPSTARETTAGCSPIIPASAATWPQRRYPMLTIPTPIGEPA